MREHKINLTIEINPRVIFLKTRTKAIESYLLMKKYHLRLKCLLAVTQRSGRLSIKLSTSLDSITARYAWNR